MVTRLYERMIDADYHGETFLETPALSSSVAHALIDKSPEHAWAAHPKLGNLPSESTDAQDTGKVLHALILGVDDGIVVVDSDAFRTKAARAAKAEAIAAGKTAITLPSYEEKLNLAMVIRGKLEDAGVDFDAMPEVAMAWEEVGAHGPVQCRGKVDLLSTDAHSVRMWDLKKVRSAAPRARQYAAMQYGLPIQRAAYVSGMTKIHPDAAGRVSFQFAFFEETAPYAVSVVGTTGQFDMYGESQWMRAVALWEDCLRRDLWTGYDLEPLDVPAWAVVQEEMEADGD